MNESRSESYRQAGVDITAGYRAVDLMKAHIARTITPGVVSGVGGFAGMFAPDLTGIARPVLVSGTDGVGTKIKIAFALDRHDTVGIDWVAMFNTNNMGVGMVLAAAPENADRLVSLLRENGEQAFILGEAAAGEGVDLL